MAKKRTAPKKNTALVRSGGSILAITKLATEIRDLIEAARNHVSVTANLALVRLYWNIGRIITQDIQRNKARAEYGVALLKELAGILTQEYGQGYSRANLQDMRRFFDVFEICQPLADKSLPSQIVQTPSGQSGLSPILQPAAGESCEWLLIDSRRHSRLGWTHYRMLLSISDPMQRQFYFEQAASQRWSKRELQRQIDRGLFERVALSRDIPRLVAQERKQTEPQEMDQYDGIFKDPYVLDFLGLKGAYSEKDLEAVIIHNLEQFLTELGTDFCFIGRQYAMRIDDRDYSLDLLFYHRGLRCLVAIDLKIGTFTAADKGQMDLYLAWLKDHDWRAGENEPVELLLRHGPHKLKVAEYLTRLPDKRLLEKRLKMYGRLLKDQKS